VGHSHWKCLSELVRLMRKEHQSSQLRGHFPHSDTHAGLNSVGGSRLIWRDVCQVATSNWP
jgi:hypothetical protein